MHQHPLESLHAVHHSLVNFYACTGTADRRHHQLQLPLKKTFSRRNIFVRTTCVCLYVCVCVYLVRSVLSFRDTPRQSRRGDQQKPTWAVCTAACCWFCENYERNRAKTSSFLYYVFRSLHHDHTATTTTTMMMVIEIVCGEKVIAHASTFTYTLYCLLHYF